MRKLPHSLAKPELDVCLFVKDLDKEERDYEPTVQHFQDLFKKKGITTVTDVIKICLLSLKKIFVKISIYTITVVKFWSIFSYMCIIDKQLGYF